MSAPLRIIKETTGVISLWDITTPLTPIFITSLDPTLMVKVTSDKLLLFRSKAVDVQAFDSGQITETQILPALPIGASANLKTLAIYLKNNFFTGTPISITIPAGGATAINQAAEIAELQNIKGILQSQVEVALLVYEDTNGNFFIRRETTDETTGTPTITWEDVNGAPATPTFPVTPASASGKTTLDAFYDVIISGVGYSVGDLLCRLAIFDSNNPTPVFTFIWLNFTTGATIAAPLPADIEKSEESVGARQLGIWNSRTQDGVGNPISSTANALNAWEQKPSIIYTPIVEKTTGLQYNMRQFYDANNNLTSTDFIDAAGNVFGFNPADVLVDNNANKTLYFAPSGADDLHNPGEEVEFIGLGGNYNIATIRCECDANERALYKVFGFDLTQGFEIPIAAQQDKFTDIVSGTQFMVITCCISGFDRVTVQMIETETIGGYFKMRLFANTVNRAINDNLIGADIKQIDLTKFTTKYSQHSYITAGNYTTQEILKTLLSFIANDSETTLLTHLANITQGTNKIPPQGQTVAAQSLPVTLASDQPAILTKTNKLTTYSATIVGLSAAAVAATDIFTITGSATKTVKIQSVKITGTVGLAGLADIVLLKRSTANSGGTSSAPTRVPHDSTNAAATATVLAYTTNPTTGTLAGNVRAKKVLLGLVSAAPQEIVWDFGAAENSQPITLRGITQVLAINLNGASFTTPVFDIVIEWTEE